MRGYILFAFIFALVLAIYLLRKNTETFTIPLLVDASTLPIQRGSKPQKIPYMIMRSFAGTDIPSILRKSVMSTYNFNPEYTHVFYTDKDCYDFMHREYAGRVANAYDTLIPGAYKSDLFRMCYLYKYGGVYFDINKVLLVPLDKLFNGNYDLVTVIDVPKEFVWQAFFACRPGLPIVGMCIDQIVRNVESRYYGELPLDITGPMMLGKLFKKYYGEGVMNPGIYRKRGELIKLLRQDGKYARDDSGSKIIDLNASIKKDINTAMNAITSNIHYHDAWNMRKVYKDDI
jgi:mannosyltransferase OCH1-like enzyme